MLRRSPFGLFACLAAAAVMLTSLAAPAAAQDNRSGCTRDVTRMCRTVMNDGDMAVLACLKQNRARLSKTCQKVLTDNNQ